MTTARRPALWLAIDGEDVDGRYQLISCSSGHTLRTRGVAEITPRKLCEWLFTIDADMRAAHPDRRPVYVTYGGNYDFQRVLRHLPPLDRAALLDGRTVRVRVSKRKCYYVSWVPRKWLKVTRAGGGAITVYDTLSYFQQSFLATARQWCPERADDLAVIETWKAKRGAFASPDWEEIVDYNDRENACLAATMQHFAAALEDTGLPTPTMWHGPGSIAAALLQRHRMHLYADDGSGYPTAICVAAKAAYYGGRTQTLQIGHWSCAYDYDITSAYPAAITSLLTSARGSWREAAPGEPIDLRGVYYVVWDVGQRSLTPFPARAARGGIGYPGTYAGWYWGVEVKAALALFGASISVQRGYAFEPSSVDCWNWYRALAAKRADLKAAGDVATARVAKLGLNSVYGKTAQRKPRQGRWYSPMWAGLITAHCRARILDFVREHGVEHAIIAIATDGILLDRHVPVETCDDLGAWNAAGEGRLELYQPGVYRLAGKSRTRGIRGGGTAEQIWDAMARQWLEHGSVRYEHSSQGVLSLQESIDCNRLADAATWFADTTVYQSVCRAEPGSLTVRTPQKDFAAPGAKSACEDLPAEGAMTRLTCQRLLGKRAYSTLTKFYGRDVAMEDARHSYLPWYP